LISNPWLGHTNERLSYDRLLHVSNLNATSFGYVHLQCTSSRAETLKAKQELECHAASYGICIKHYHADNGRFAENVWMKAVSDANQMITFCGIGAQH